MSESSGVPKAFLEWLNAKKSVSTPPIEMPKNELETETITATTVQLETVPEARIQREIAQTQVAHTLIMESVRIDFPLKPYPAQLQMMSKIIYALNRSENALLESPTGSGKSLALLCAALAWRRKEINKRFERSQAEIVDSDNPDFGQKDKEPFKKRKREDISKQRKRVKRESHVSLDDDFQPNQLLNKLAKTDIENLSLSDTGIKKQETMPTLSSETGIPQIYVGSRTHKQLSQLISELKRNTQFKPKMTVLGSREQFCIHPKVSKSPNKNDDCVSLLDSNSCSYFHRTRKLVSLPEFDSEDRVWDIEDMVRLGKSTGGCPYYASRNFFETAEIVFCPYNYILDPVIRKIVNINLENSIVILDEAHNMEDAARSAGSFELDDKSLSMLKIELSQIIKNGYEIHAHGILEHLFNIIWEWITSPENFYEIKEYERHIHVWSSQKIVEKLEELNITGYIYQTQFVPAYTTAVAHADLVRKENEKDASESRHKTVPNDNGEGVVIHKRKCLSNSCLNTIQGVFMIFGNLFREDCNYNDDYRMVAMKRIDKSGGMLRAKKGKGKTKSKVDSTWLYKLGFWCLNPGVIFQDMCKKTKSVILTSGTLSPMASFATELDTQFAASLEANHVIDPSQVWVSCLPVGPNGTSLKGIYSNIESLQYQDDVGEAICQISDKIPYGVLCFLPSYNAMDKLLERWDLTGIKDRMEVKKLVFSEPKGSDKKVFEKMIKKFYDQIDKAVNRPTEEKGAIFFAVYRGKVSEGIDFTNEYCRAVIALGIPYPGIKDMEVKLKKEYNDQKRMNSKNSNFLSGREWYSIQAYRAINQALGRCIRHKNDWGAIILLEDRFQAQETIKGLSKWIRGKIQIHQQFSDGMSGLEDFVQSRLRIQNGQNASEQEQQAKLAVGNQQAYVTTEPKEKSEAISPTPRITIETEAEQKNIQSGEVYSSSIIDNQDLVTIQTNMIKNNVIQGLPDASWEDNIPTIQNIDNDSNALRKAEEVCVIENEDQQAVNAGSKLDALLIEIDSDSEFESCEPVQQQTHNFFKKPSTSKARNNLRPVACSRCEHVLMEGDTDLLKPIDNIHLNCILYSNQMDTRMVEVQEPSTWGATTLNLDIAQLPTEAPVLMNKIDKLCYQKLHCKCNQVVGVLICGAISPEKENYVGKVYFWEDSVKYEKERQRAWKQPVKKDDIDDSWNASASSQVTTMTDMFYNLP